MGSPLSTLLLGGRPLAALEWDRQPRTSSDMHISISTSISRSICIYIYIDVHTYIQIYSFYLYKNRDSL